MANPVGVCTTLLHELPAGTHLPLIATIGQATGTAPLQLVPLALWAGRLAHAQYISCRQLSAPGSLTD